MSDPCAAAEAIQVIIKRDQAQHSMKLTQRVTATGTKIAGLFADLGTATTVAIGVAKTMASIGPQPFSLGLDIKNMRADNKRLAQPISLDLTVFNDGPVLGCCLLTCTDTSAVAKAFIADIDLPSWMDRMEAMKKKQEYQQLTAPTGRAGFQQGRAHCVWLLRRHQEQGDQAAGPVLARLAPVGRPAGQDGV